MSEAVPRCRGEASASDFAAGKVRRGPRPVRLWPRGVVNNLSPLSKVAEEFGRRVTEEKTEQSLSKGAQQGLPKMGHGASRIYGSPRGRRRALTS